MKERVILKLIEVVSRNITDKDDFYKYRLPQIAAMSEDQPFVISFSSSTSHFLNLSEVNIQNNLVDSEVERFRFMENPSADMESFVYYTNWQERKSLWNGAITPSDVVLYYDGNEITELCESKKVIFPHSLRIMWNELTNAAVNFVRETYPTEVPYYGTKIPVRFANENIFKRFLKCSHMEHGERLAKVVRRFRDWPRRAVNEEIIIGYDFAPNSFSFAQMVNNRSIMNGGIIYQDENWGMHT